MRLNVACSGVIKPLEETQRRRNELETAAAAAVVIGGGWKEPGCAVIGWGLNIHTARRRCYRLCLRNAGWINKGGSWRWRNLDKARQQLISKRSNTGARESARTNTDDVKSEPHEQTHSAVKTRRPSERTGLTRDETRRLGEEEHCKHNRHVCRCSPARQMFQKTTYYTFISARLCWKSTCNEKQAENVFNLEPERYIT